MNPNQTHKNFALLGGVPAFDTPVGTSGLLRPDFDQFMDYSRQFFDAKHYSNNGPLVRQLENRLAQFHNAQYCVAFCSGFWSIALAINAMKLPNRDEVVMPSFTYRRLADIVAWCGLKPRFCEVDETTLAITPATASHAITEQTALILGVHPIVNCCDVMGLQTLADKRGIPLLMDSVESVYEISEQGRVGSMAQAEVFSLHASKLINGGEGGYITTSDKDLYETLTIQRSFGFKGADNIATGGGTNAKLNEMHAGMALASLDSLEGFVAHNEKIYRIYQQGIPKISGLKLRTFDETHRTSYKNIVIEITEDWPFTRDVTVQLLNAEQVLARAYYAPALHQKDMHYPHCKASLPLTDKLSERFILMPSGYRVTPKEIEGVLHLLKNVYDHAHEILSKIEGVPQ